MNTTRIALILVLLLSGAFAPAAEATTYDLYYLGGQSNMDGYGYLEDLPPELRGPVKGVMVFHGNTSPDGAVVDGRGLWAELRPGHGVGYTTDGRTATYSDRFGVERQLRSQAPRARSGGKHRDHQVLAGRQLDQCDGGRSLRLLGPGLPGRHVTGINQYDHFLATVRHAMSIGDINGDGEADTLVPKGIIWMQGESDAASRQEDRTSVRRATSSDSWTWCAPPCGTDDLPVVIGRISDSGRDEKEKDGKVWNHGEIVREAQQSFVSNDPRAALVASTDAYGYSDPWHYDSAGYLDLGTEFAVAVHGLQEADRRSAAGEKGQD